jgi:hypothetical protein
VCCTNEGRNGVTADRTRSSYDKHFHFQSLKKPICSVTAVAATIKVASG